MSKRFRAPKASAHVLQHVLNSRHRFRPVRSKRDADGSGSTKRRDARTGSSASPRHPRVTLDDSLPPEDWAGYGERTDIDALYRDQRPQLIRFFARRAAAEDVSDLVQEVFRRLLGTASATHLRIDNPEAYLRRVADNVLRDQARKPSHRATHVEWQDDAIPGPDPHRQLESRDSVARIDEAMQRLKPKTREIFMLHRLDGLSYAEIAAIKGLSVKGVEKQIGKALGALRRQLDRH